MIRYFYPTCIFIVIDMPLTNKSNLYFYRNYTFSITCIFNCSEVERVEESDPFQSARRCRGCDPDDLVVKLVFDVYDS